MTFLNFIISEAPQSIESLSKDKINIRIEKSPTYRKGIEITAIDPSTKKKIGNMILVDSYEDNIWTIHSKITPDYRSQGYGVLLYDICIEYITSKFNGMTMSTYGNGAGSTSEVASNIWKYYFTNRNDVEIYKNTGRRDPEEGPYNIQTSPWLWSGFKKKLKVIPTLQQNKILKITI